MNGKDAPAPTLHIHKASLTLGGREIFRNLHLTIPGGRFTALLGPSGVGKTSLLRLFAGLAPLTGPTEVTTDDGMPLPGRIAWMGQQDLLLPWATVLDNVLLGRRLRGQARDGAARDRAMALLERVGLTERADDRPAALSGGQRQRVALARTLFEDRPIVLMDEPFSALDALTRLRLGDMAASLLAGRTVLMVTHDPMEALRLADIVQIITGTPAELAEPLSPPGQAPRPPDGESLLRMQATLLARLASGSAA